MELWGGEGGDDLAGGVFELHHIHKGEVVVGEGRHNVLLEAADGRHMGLFLWGVRREEGREGGLRRGGGRVVQKESSEGRVWERECEGGRVWGEIRIL